MSKTIMQDSDIVIRNLDVVFGEENHYINKHPRAPKFPFRICVSGPSSCGKTNFVLEMIINYLYYDKVYFYSTSLEQGKYKKLKEYYKMLDEEIEKEWEKKQKKNEDKNGKSYVTAFKAKINPKPEPIADFVNIDEGLPDISSVDASKQNILVFDDCILNKDQSSFINFFVRGRHKGCSCIYLTQKFHAVPNMIRDQLTDIIFYTKPSMFALNAISASVSSGADYADLKEIFKRAMPKPFDFLHIDLRTPDLNKRFKRNMNTPISLDEVREYIENKPRRKVPKKDKKDDDNNGQEGV